VISGDLREARERFGPAPRSFPDPETAAYLAAPPQTWPNDEPAELFFHRILADRAVLLRHGQIVWSRLVRLNKRLWEPGDRDHPGRVVYGLDPELTGTSFRLQEISDAVVAAPRTEPPDRAHEQVAAVLTKGADLTVRVPVPVALTGGLRHVYLTSVIVQRSHLPDGYLRANILPLLTAPDRTPATMVLPSRYWPGWLLRQWAVPGR
jgi:hypothetical protein